MITLESTRRSAALIDPWAGWGLSRLGLARFLARARRAVPLAGEVDLLLTGDAGIRKLNREYRGKDKATDVLSFPALEAVRSAHAGDLVISLETAGRQAAEHGHTLEHEVRILVLHGLLHLAGMDHETDGGRMARRESMLREQLRLPVGLIERVERGKEAVVRRRRVDSGRVKRVRQGSGV